MHQPVFDSDIEQAAMFETRKTGIIRSEGAQRGIDRFAQSRVVTLYLLDPGPIFRLVIRQAPVDWVNAEGEELIEIRIERRKSQRSKQKVPIESFEMAQVKNDTVALGDRAVVECFRPDNFK
jgi:hypothetical protein